MGEAKRRVALEDRELEVDITKILFSMGARDRRNLATQDFATFRGDQGWVFDSPEDEQRYRALSAEDRRRTVCLGAFHLLLNDLVARKFRPEDPQKGSGGLKRRDGRFLAVWQRLVVEEQAPALVTWGAVDWLTKQLVCNDELAVQPSFAHWREAVADYLEMLEPPPAREGAE